MKRCSKCGLEKDESEFYKHKQGFRSSCKDCYRIACRAYNETHSETVKAQRKSYSKSHSESIRIKLKTWYQAHVEEVRAAGKAYRETHTEEIADYRNTHFEKRSAQGKAWYKAHSEKKKEYSRTRYSSRSDEMREAAKVYRISHPEEVRVAMKAWRESHPERLKIRDICFYCSTVVKPLILKRDSHKCQLCGSGVHLEIHHISPIKIDPDLILNPTNLITLCHECHYFVAHPHHSTKRVDLTVAAHLSTLAFIHEVVNPTDTPLFQK